MNPKKEKYKQIHMEAFCCATTEHIHKVKLLKMVQEIGVGRKDQLD